MLTKPAHENNKSKFCRVLTGTDIRDQIVHALVGKQFGKQARPVRLNLDVGSCCQLLNVISLQETSWL